MFKATKVAAIFDWDKTLSPDYMQKVIFDYYQVNEEEFWFDCQVRSKEHITMFGSSHNELDYMNTILKYARTGRFKGINNKLLSDLGQKIVFYPGVEWMLNELWTLGVEVYIVSAGIKVMLDSVDSRVQKATGNNNFKLSGVFAGSFRCDEDGASGLTSIATCMDAIGKTKAIYEISKGCNIYGYDFTTSIPKGGRRIPLESILYCGDGPSDAPAMNLIHDSGGFTIGVFNKDRPEQFTLIENIRAGNRLDIVAVADYRPGATASHWIINKAKELIEKSSEEYYLKKLLGLRGERSGF